MPPVKVVRPLRFQRNTSSKDVYKRQVLERIDPAALGSREVKTGRSINLMLRALPWPADTAVPVSS